MPHPLFLAAAITIALWLGWTYIPRHPRIKNWLNFKRSMKLCRKLEREKAEVSVALELPAALRLPRLMELHERLGSAWMTGDQIRQEIFATGQDDTLPFIENYIKDPRSRIFTLTHGVRKALEQSDAQEHYKVRVFQLLLPFVDQRGTTSLPVGADDIPDILLKLDREWGERVLNSPEYLTRENRLFQNILRAFNKHGVIIEKGKIESWLLKGDMSNLTFSESLIHLELVRALVFHDPSECESLLVKMAKANIEDVSRWAVEALLEMRGVIDPRDQVIDKVENRGVGQANDFEKTIWLVDQYGSRVYENGIESVGRGFHPEGVTLDDIANALAEIGAFECAQIMRKLQTVLAAAGPEITNQERQQRVIELGEVWIEKVEAIEDAHQREDASLLQIIYIMDHLQHLELVQTQEVPGRGKAWVA